MVAEVEVAPGLQTRSVRQGRRGDVHGVAPVIVQDDDL
jgi:hypothetical protein